MLETKPGVESDGVSREVWFAVGVAYALCSVVFKPDMVITSMRDGVHQPHSLHPTGYAADLRTKDMTEGTAGDWARRVAVILDPLGFDVVNEIDPRHLHIEFDPKPGEIFFASLQEKNS